MSMTSHTYQALGPHGFHRVHYTEWGERDNPKVLLCVHGFTRTCRDFDFLAAALEKEYRVICPDVVGRGQSDWLDDKADYSYPLYVNDMAMLLARIDAERIDWVGTSMGGLIGMFLASYPGNPIHKLVINDVGPRIPAAALKRVGDYVGRVITFATIEEMDRTFRLFAAPFGTITDAQWRHMIVHSARQLADGRYTTAYDPGIAEAFKTLNAQDIDLWSVWDAIQSPTLVVRGALSDVLEATDAIAMTTRGPKATLVELPGMGHAPALMADDQIAIVQNWLLEN